MGHSFYDKSTKWPARFDPESVGGRHSDVLVALRREEAPETEKPRTVASVPNLDVIAVARPGIGYWVRTDSPMGEVCQTIIQNP